MTATWIIRSDIRLSSDFAGRYVCVLSSTCLQRRGFAFVLFAYLWELHRSTTRTRTNVNEWHNNPLAPSVNDRLILASIRFSNIAVQENAVQQPVQQRRRTSAKNNNTQRTERSSFQHTMHTGEHQRTGCVESPLRHAEQNTRSPPIAQVPCRAT